MTPRRGDVFLHPTRLYPEFRPAAGQTYRGGPKARCVVTRVTSTAVYYQYADDRGSPCGGKCVVDRDKWTYS